MNFLEKHSIRRYHRARLNRWPGDTLKAQGWSSEQAQQRRFEVIVQLHPFQGLEVLDLGCGCGDLLGYLQQWATPGAYVGIDLQPTFINYAQRRFASDKRARFYCRDFGRVALPKVDVVVASGSLSYRCQDAEYFRRMIRKMYASAEQALIFNMLDQSHFEAGDYLTGHEPEAILAFCRALCTNAELVADYLDDDFTIYMPKCGEDSAP